MKKIPLLRFLALCMVLVTLIGMAPVGYATELGSDESHGEQNASEPTEAMEETSYAEEEAYELIRGYTLLNPLEGEEEEATTYVTATLSKDLIRQILTTSREREDISYTDQVGYVSAWVTAQ